MIAALSFPISAAWASRAGRVEDGYCGERVHQSQNACSACLLRHTHSRGSGAACGFEPHAPPRQCACACVLWVRRQSGAARHRGESRRAPGAYLELQNEWPFSIEIHTCQGCFLHSFCIFNRNCRKSWHLYCNSYRRMLYLSQQFSPTTLPPCPWCSGKRALPLQGASARNFMSILRCIIGTSPA